MARRSRLFVVHVALVGVVAVLALGATTASGDTGPPVPTVLPIATGPAGVGKQLSTTSGSWSTSATFVYQWVRCDAFFSSCTNISGATAPTYTVVIADAGHVLGANVTATNDAGSAVALSNGLGPVAAYPPGSRHRPSIKGAKKVGRRVYETADRWTQFPDTFTNRWLRCSARGSACVRITGKRLRCVEGACLRVNVGTEWDYKLTDKDVGHRLRVRVTASNGAGRGISISKPTRVITR